MLSHTRFPGVRLKPLIHLSVFEAIASKGAQDKPESGLPQPDSCLKMVFPAAKRSKYGQFAGFFVVIVIPGAAV